MEITPELLKKYMQGRCTEEEAKAVESWHNSATESFKSDSDVPIPPFLEDRIWENIDRVARNGGIPKKKAPWNNFKMVGIAATLLILIGIATFIFQGGGSSIRTQAGETKTLVLEDGTKVHLNVASTLSVANKFDEGKREVFLDGEAFFDVVTNEKQPFTVKTKSSITRVLGTQFNLRAYKEGLELLTLKEGSVRYSTKNLTDKEQIVLQPDEQALLMDGEIQSRSVKVSDYLGWMSNTLIFNNENLSEIAKTLERRFDVKIRIDDKELMAEPFKGKFENPVLEVVLTDLGFVMKFDYRREDGTIILY